MPLLDINIMKMNNNQKHPLYYPNRECDKGSEDRNGNVENNTDNKKLATKKKPVVLLGLGGLASYLFVLLSVFGFLMLGQSDFANAQFVGDQGSGSTVDNKVMTLKPNATAGGSVTVCVDDEHEVVGATAANGQIQWTHDGSGVLLNPTSINPTYIPDLLDQGSVVTLTLEVTNAPCTGSATAEYYISVDNLPQANGTGLVTICSNETHMVTSVLASYGHILWTHNGNGSLIDETTINPTYIPDVADEGNTVVLKMMVTSASTCAPKKDSILYNINVDPQPVAIAGGNATICSNGSHTLTGTAAEYGTIQWTHTGFGTLVDDNTLNPTYSAVPADAGTTVNLTMTVTSDNVCNPQTAVANYTIDVEALPTAYAGGTATICSNESHTVSGAGGVFGSISWTHDGAGSLSNPTFSTPTYNAAPGDEGNTVTLTITVTSLNACFPQVDQDTYTIDVDPQPVAIAGGHTTICSNASHTVIDAEAHNGDILWEIVSGNGTLDNPTTLSPTYNAVAADENSTVNLRMTVTSTNSCNPQTDVAFYTIDVDPLPVAIAGGSTAICSDGFHEVIGASSSYGDVLWTHDGNGYLFNAELLNPTYVADLADEGNTVTLTLTVTSTNVCNPQIDQDTYTIQVDPQPQASAGGSAHVCSNSSHTVVGANSANGDILWTHNGNGTLDDPTTLSPTYNPVASDEGNTVDLTMTVSSVNACVPQQAVADYTIYVDPLPVAIIGETETTICSNDNYIMYVAEALYGDVQWTHNGNGTLLYPTGLTPIYFADPLDEGNTVTLTLTVTSDNDCNPQTDVTTFDIHVDPQPVAIAGGSATICSNANHSLLGTNALNGNVLWTHNGEGTLDDNTLVAPTYFPTADDEGNTVTLTMTVTSDNTCNPQTDFDTYTIDIDPLPVAIAGGTATICSNASHTIEFTEAYHGDILWTHDGNGVLDDNSIVAPTYYPTAADEGNTVTLTMRVSSVNTCTPQYDEATYTINIDPLPVAIAGGDVIICSDATHTLAGVTALNGTIVWTHDGDGYITDNYTTSPTYHADEDDEGQTVTLTMTVTSDNTCLPQMASDTYLVHVDPLPVAIAGGHATVCSNGTHTVLGAEAYHGDILWTHNGNGTITDGTTVAPTYIPDFADQGTTITLTMTVSSANACHPHTDVATYTIDIDELPVAIAGGSATICSSGQHQLAGASSYFGDILWTHDGTGNLLNPTMINPIYVASESDEGNTVTLTLTVTSDNECNPQIDQDTYTIVVDPQPQASAGGSFELCSNDTHTVVGASSAHGDILWTHNGNGTLTDETTLTPTYTPDFSDEGNTVLLTMTVSSVNACNPQTAVAYYTINVNPLPVAIITETEVSICSDDSYTMYYAETYHGDRLWTHNGNGNLVNPTGLNPIYFPDVTDEGNTVTLTLTVSSVNACNPITDVATFDIHVDAIPIAIAGGSTEICSTDTHTLVGTEAYNGDIVWTHDGDGTLDDNTIVAPTYTPVPSDEGNTVTLTMTVSTTNTCSDIVATADYTIQVDPLPVAIAGGYARICSEDSHTVSLAQAHNGTILWTHDGQGTLVNETTIIPTYTAAPEDEGNTVTLTLTVTSDNTCTPQTDVATYTIDVDPQPIAIAGGSSTICVNGSHTIVGAEAYYGTIMWTHDGDGELIDPTTLTPTYVPWADDAGKTIHLTMTVTSDNACGTQFDPAIAYYTIAIDSLPVAKAGGEFSICSDGQHTIVGASSLNGTVSWTHNGNGNLTDINTLTPTYFADVTDGGNDVVLTMTVTSDNTCAPQVDTAIYTIHVLALPVPQVFASDTIVNFNETVEVWVTGADEVMWNPELIMGCHHCDRTIFNAPPDLQEDTYFNVVAMASNEMCHVSDSIQILVLADITLTVPNAFSPNGDGVDDFWVINELSRYPENELKIYTRWGDLIYEASPYLNDWEGLNSDGSPLPAGTYFYILETKKLKNTVYKGYVYINY
jgi:gliding motility-associated-like protein